MKIDWRKHDKKAPDSIYVKLAKPGDVLRFSGFGNQSWQVQRVVPVTTSDGVFGYVKVKFYGRNAPMPFAPTDRAKLVFRFANSANVEKLDL